MRPSADMSKNLARTSCKKPNWHRARVNHHFLTTTVGYIANCPVEWFTDACKIPTTSHILGQQLAPSVRSMVLSPHAYHAVLQCTWLLYFGKRLRWWWFPFCLAHSVAHVPNKTHSLRLSCPMDERTHHCILMYLT